MAFVSVSHIKLRKPTVFSTFDPSTNTSTTTCLSSLPQLSRRSLISIALSAVPAFLLPKQSHAISGLRIFPLQQRLTNAYYLMRACETISDAASIVRSNPVDKLSLEKHSLTPRGVKQAIRASEALVKQGLESDAWLWPSMTTSSFETAEIIASKLRIRREQIVPEYSFLDARGMGILEGGNVSEARRLVIENDQKDPNWRPIPGEDGTPNDSSEDVFVRVRQLLSKLETQYVRENIVIVSPDSDPLSILQSAMTGEDLRNHHDHEYIPGELRRVQELVVDAYGELVVQPGVVVLSKPTPRSQRT